MGLVEYAVLVLVIGYLGFLPWVLSSYGLFPSDTVVPFLIMGGFSPTVAAIVVLRRHRGVEGTRGLFDLFKRKFPLWWLLVAFVLQLALFYAGMWLQVVVQGTGTILPPDPLLLLVMFIQAFVMNVWEEIGWRGYALPVLQERYNALVSGIILGVIWAAWHVPHFLVKDSGMLRIYGSFWIILIGNIIASIVYVWMFNSSNGNLFVVTVFHATQNALGAMTVLQALPIVSALYLIPLVFVVATILVLVYGPRGLSRDEPIKASDLY